MIPGAQNKKTGPDDPGTAAKESGRAKHENGIRRLRYRRKQVRVCKACKRDPTPIVSLKMSAGAQNMKTKPNALGTSEDKSGSVKHENGTQRPRYRQKRVRERITLKRDPTPSVPPKMSPGGQNMKTGPDALGTVENESRRAKQENGTRRPRYRRKLV
jgi:hypothetical protein